MLIAFLIGGWWTETGTSVDQLWVIKIVWKELFQAILAAFISSLFHRKAAGLTSNITAKSDC